MGRLFTTEEIENFIRHYQEDLQEIYSLLMVLEKENLVKRGTIPSDNAQ
jgi:hypothetical protein